MKPVIIAATVLSLMAGTAAMADSRDGHDRGRNDQRHSHDWRHNDKHHDNDRDRRRDNDRYDYRKDDRKDGRYDRNYRDNHRDYGRDYRRNGPPRYKMERYHHPHGYYHRSWHRGDRLPSGWYSSRYVVNNYHVYNLRRPPRGYHWVRVNNDVVLAAIAGGIVAEVVLDLFY